MAAYLSLHQVKQVIVTKKENDEHNWTVVRIITGSTGILNITLHHENDEIEWTLPGVQGDE